MNDIDKTFEILKKIPYEEICNKFKETYGESIYSELNAHGESHYWSYYSMHERLRKFVFACKWSEKEFIVESNRRIGKH